MDIKTEKIVDKIKKLLKLSENNPSEEEAYTAFQRAQALMVEYKLSMADVTDKEVKTQKCIKKKINLSYGTRSSDHYLDDLAHIVAENFCCINCISTPRRSHTHYIVLMGLEDDVAIAEEVIYTANHQIIRGYNKVYKEVCQQYGFDYLPAKYFNPLKIGYIEGYLAGLKKALEAQRDAHQEEWGLVLVTPKEATDFLAGLDKSDFGSDCRADLSYYSEGFNDGSSFNMNKKLDK